MITNQRTIPTTENFKKSVVNGRAKEIDDIVYMFLQSISKRREDEDHRYTIKSEINISEIANGKGSLLSISRQTYYNRLNDLKAAGFVIEDESYYKLPTPEMFFLIPHDTLVYLLDNGVNEGVFKLFAWLGNRERIMSGNVIFSENVLIEEVLGTNKTSTPQHRRVQNNLDLLSRLGLIRCVRQETAKGNMVYKMTHFSTAIGGLDAIDWDKGTYIRR